MCRASNTHKAHEAVADMFFVHDVFDLLHCVMVGKRLYPLQYHT